MYELDKSLYNKMTQDLQKLRSIKLRLITEISAGIKAGDKEQDFIFDIVKLLEFSTPQSSSEISRIIENKIYELTNYRVSLVFEAKGNNQEQIAITWEDKVYAYIINSGTKNFFTEFREELQPLREIISLLTVFLIISARLETNFKRLEIINNITLIMSSSLNIDEVYTRFAKEIRKVIGFDRITIALFEGDEYLYVFGIASDIESQLTKGKLVPAANSAPNWVRERGCTHIAGDISKKKEFWEEEVLAREGIKSAIRTPLKIKGKVIGTLNLNSKKSNLYGEEEKNFIEQVAGQIATAIQNAQFYEEREKKNQELQRKNLRLATINAISQVVSESLDLNEVVQNSLSKVKEVFKMDYGAIYLLEEATNNLEFKYQQGIFQDSFEKLANEGVVNKVIKIGEPLIYYNQDNPLRSLAYIPLKAKNKVVGVMPIATLKERLFTEGDCETLASVGNQIGVAIENALLYQKIKHMAEFDNLTQVYNRGLFFKLAEQELNRAERFGLEFSILMLDVDLFKEYNDQFGHLAGDEVLKTLAGLLKDNLREMDVVARYGGEEFVILAAESGKDEAFEMAERIRKIVETEGQSTAFPTLSIGIASYPEDGQEIEDILRSADTALYLAKGKRNYCQRFSLDFFQSIIAEA